jgi:3',5'-cyclic AMP phosphodiesterase CpdA
MQFNRRTFLATTAAVGGATLLETHWLPAAEKLAEFSFVIVSDTHLGRQDSKTPERQWRQAIAEINAAPGDFVLHLGDVVDGGREAQYPLYAEIRQELKKPIHELPGNHDPVPLFEKHIRTPIDRSFDHAGVRFLLFNNSHNDSHLGFISPEQIAWLDKQCADAAGKDLRIVIGCHVPIHKNLSPDRGWYVKPDDGQTAFYGLVARHADRLLACFHGHFHNGIRGWRDRGSLVEVLCPSVCYNQDRRLAEAIKEQKTAGFFVEELRPGYVLVTLGNGKLTMRYKPLGAELHGEYSAELS